MCFSRMASFVIGRTIVVFPTNMRCSDSTSLTTLIAGTMVMDLLSSRHVIDTSFAPRYEKVRSLLMGTSAMSIWSMLTTSSGGTLCVFTR